VSSTIYEDGVYQIIRLERRFPPTQVAAESVAEELRERVRRRLVDERMQRIAAFLFDNANIEFTDSGLLRAFARRHPNKEINLRPGW
jgi:hypothetical protein